MKRLWFILFFSLGLTVVAFGQSKEKKKSKKLEKEGDWGATYQVDSKKVRKKLKKSVYKHFDAKIEEYEKRMEANAKKYKKMEKEMKKPQYSDPTYFGHKKPPKKRPPGKKKFCKVCRMWH